MKSVEQGEEVSLKVGELHETYRASLKFAVLEEEYGRDVAYAVFCYNLCFLIDVELGR